MNMNHIVGHDSEGFARSDGDDFIVKRTADVKCAEIPLKINVFSLSS